MSLVSKGCGIPLTRRSRSRSLRFLRKFNVVQNAFAKFYALLESLNSAAKIVKIKSREILPRKYREIPKDSVIFRHIPKIPA
jgi:hypothetical protein